jgi:hypothetical protein
MQSALVGIKGKSQEEMIGNVLSAFIKNLGKNSDFYAFLFEMWCADLQNTVLSIHNRERAAVVVPALVWSGERAAGAKTWAEHLATSNQMVHDPAGFGHYGENLAWRGHGEGDTLPLMVESWVAEKNGYTLVPYQYNVDDRVDHAHYTAMVWGTTTEVGCGMATGSVNDFLVCRYIPGGNANGQLPYGQGAAQAVAEEDAGALPADQAAGDEDGGGGGDNSRN